MKIITQQTQGVEVDRVQWYEFVDHSPGECVIMEENTRTYTLKIHQGIVIASARYWTNKEPVYYLYGGCNYENTL